MDQFSGGIPFWEISQTTDSISQLPDDDFLALLQKQFPTQTNTFGFNFPGFNSNGVDPQSISDAPFPIHTTPTSSNSSSPSPASADTDAGPSRRPSLADRDDITLKRKASDEDMDAEPTHKSPHTVAFPSASSQNPPSVKKSTSRRKPGNPTQDEVRLLKRKEQNRAAQRAFRERKEKHVKDLEDKVAALEARNQRTESENENLRDLLSRLQDENLQLKKQTAFTFSVEKDQKGHFSSTTAKPDQNKTPNSSSPESTKSTNLATPQSRFLTPNSSAEFNFGSLIPFDPAVLSALDDSHAPSSNDAMNLDFGFGKQISFNMLASDPTYMSFAEPSPTDSPSSGTGYNVFDFSSLDTWSRSGPQSNSTNGGGMQTLDELFGGNNSFLGTQTGLDIAAILKNTPAAPTVSPVIRTTPPSAANLSPTAKNSVDSPSTASQCPTTRAQLSEIVANDSLSSFVQSPTPSAPSCEIGTFLKKNAKEPPMVMCRGSSFPKTEQNEKNVEVLSAWRSITSNPQFKDVDINELCTEFTDKARCDGTKVVLEPEGVHSIIEALNAKYQKQQAQRI